MKTAVVSIAIGNLYQEVAKISHPRFQKYAENNKADFIAITENKAKNAPTAHWSKLYFND